MTHRRYLNFKDTLLFLQLTVFQGSCGLNGQRKTTTMQYNSTWRPDIYPDIYHTAPSSSVNLPSVSGKDMDISDFVVSIY